MKFESSLTSRTTSLLLKKNKFARRTSGVRKSSRIRDKLYVGRKIGWDNSKQFLIGYPAHLSFIYNTDKLSLNFSVSFPSNAY